MEIPRLNLLDHKDFTEKVLDLGWGLLENGSVYLTRFKDAAGMPQYLLTALVHGTKPGLTLYKCVCNTDELDPDDLAEQLKKGVHGPIELQQGFWEV